MRRENDQGASSPLYLYQHYCKMNVSVIKDALAEQIVAQGCFLVDVSVSKDNEIEITIESEEGIIDLEDCVNLSRYFETVFDREVEDYALTVTSAGLDQPFKVIKQYLKAVGTKVEVAFKGGKKMVALLEAADEEGITLKYSVKESVEGSKKKVMVEHTDKFTMEQVNSVRPFIEFEK